MDGTLNRNSSPQAITAFRDAYDGFLLKFPLLFGYWKKYADQEFNIAGPESAEMVSRRAHTPYHVRGIQLHKCFGHSGRSLTDMTLLQIYERGCASITNSVDLWTEYCSFKMETTHTPHLVRE